MSPRPPRSAADSSANASPHVGRPKSSRPRSNSSATGIVSLSATARRPGCPFTHPPAGRWIGFIRRPNQQRGRRPARRDQRPTPPPAYGGYRISRTSGSGPGTGSGGGTGCGRGTGSGGGTGSGRGTGSGGGTGSGRRTALRGHDRDWGSCRRPGLRSSSRLACRGVRHRHSRPAGSSVILSASLAVRLEGRWIRSDKGSVAFTGDGQPDHIITAVVLLDERPDDDRERALRGPHLGSVQGGCDLQDLHRRHGRRGHRGALGVVDEDLVTDLAGNEAETSLVAEEPSRYL